jgi:molybdate transport system permease protein
VAAALRLSLQVAVCATLLTLVVGTTLAYILARKQFRGKEVLDLLLTLPIVLPPVVTGYYLVALIGRNGVLGRALAELTGQTLQLMFTWYGAVLAAFVVSVPLMIKTGRAAIEAVDQELINVSYTLGRSDRDTALHVVLPLARPGLFAGLTLAFARALGEFGATLMVAGNIPGKTTTMPLEIYNQVVYGDWAQASLFVLFFTCLSGTFLYLAGRVGRRTAVY